MSSSRQVVNEATFYAMMLLTSFDNVNGYVKCFHRKFDGLDGNNNVQAAKYFLHAVDSSSLDLGQEKATRGVL